MSFIIVWNLEGGWAVGEAEEHDKEFEEVPICLKGSFPLISLLDLYIVVFSTYVQLCEVLCIGVQDPINDIQYEGEWVGVCHMS